MMTTYTPPHEVAEFDCDLEALGYIYGPGVWNVTPEWAEKFSHHRDALMPLAESGSVWAQYSLSVIYCSGLLHTSEAAYLAAYPEDEIQMTHWLGLAAAAGHVGALDNMLCVRDGISTEAERLKSIYRSNPELFKNSPPPSSAWEAEMRTLHELAYKNR